MSYTVLLQQIHILISRGAWTHNRVLIMKIAFPQSMIILYSSENFNVFRNGLEVTYLDTLHGLYQLI